MKKLLLIFCGFLTLTAYAQQDNWHQFDVRHITQDVQPIQANQAALRAQSNWQDFKAAHGNWWVTFDELTGMPMRATGTPITLSGGDLEAKSMSFLTTELAQFNIPMTDLVSKGARSSSKFHFVEYKQFHEGVEVLFSSVSTRFTLDERLMLFSLEVHPNITVSTTPSVTTGMVAAASTGIPTAVTSSSVSPDLKILPVRAEGKYNYHLAYEVTFNTAPLNGVPGEFIALVDAHTGELLSRKSLVHECASMLTADVTVEATVTDNPIAPTVNRGLPYIRVNVGGVDYYADDMGVVNIPTVTAPTTGTVFMDGLWVEVYKGGTAISSFPVTINPGPNTISLDGLADPTEISGYYHTSVVHDHAKSLFPAYTDSDFPFPCNVDLTSGDCNAFYDGSSINFYAPGGCYATALFADVVYHEYGHGLNYDLYNYFGGFWNNGALGEGYADIWGLGITDDPILGEGWSFSATSFVRRYDIDPKVYPADLVGQVHADGEIIAGAWWDLGQLFGSTSDMIDLWAQTWPAVPMSADGDEGNLYRNILLEALIADDDDGDLSTGTPNDDDIIEAFALHGITLLANASVDHIEADLEDATAMIEIDADLSVDFPAYLGDFLMYWRVNDADPWTQVVMAAAGAGADSYTASIPAQPEGTVLQYYFEVQDSYGYTAVEEPAKVTLADPNLPYYSLIGYNIVVKEDFDNEFGDWVINPEGNDNATTGIWEVGSPIATTSGSVVVQTGSDHTTEGANLNFCAYTGNGSVGGGLGENDIDGGKTSIRSNPFDATSLDDPTLTYYRWFANDPPTGANPGNDPLVVSISNDGTNWVRVEQTYTSDNSWRRNVVKISDYVSPTSTVYLMFTASDSLLPGSGLPFDGGSLVEAAVDDVYLYGKGYEDTTSNNTGIEDQLADQLAVTVFPNPTAGSFTVTVGENILSNVEVEILSNNGQLIWKNAYARVDGQLSIPDLGLAEGVYLLQVTMEGKQLVKRITVQQ